MSHRLHHQELKGQLIAGKGKQQQGDEERKEKRHETKMETKAAKKINCIIIKNIKTTAFIPPKVQRWLNNVQIEESSPPRQWAGQ